tara:strand:- start:2209 stop:2310 length:102 start_codon:yes stop_codon:yes gene_type:complete
MNNNTQVFFGVPLVKKIFVSSKKGKKKAAKCRF